MSSGHLNGPTLVGDFRATTAISPASAAPRGPIMPEERAGREIQSGIGDCRRTIAAALGIEASAGDDAPPEHVNGAAHDAAALVENEAPATDAQLAAHRCVGTLARMPGDTDRFRTICRLIGGQVARGELDRTWATDLLSEGADI